MASAEFQQRFTEREQRVITLVCRGLRNVDIADDIGTSEQTIGTNIVDSVNLIR
jgi:DNA-binding NarL/FixJ family response regulator